MAPRDDFSNSPHGDASHNATSEPFETVPIEETQQEVEEWAQSEGYTPLSGLHEEGGGMMFMMAPEGDDAQTYAFQASQGAFFADMGAVESGGEEDILDCELQPSSVVEDFVPQHDFRFLAEQALRSLDDEYAMTLQGVNVELEREKKSDRSKEELSHPALAPSNDEQNMQQAKRQSEVKAAAISSLKLSPVPKFEKAPPPPPINTDAVKRVVASIQLKDTKISQRYQEWQETLEHHPFIPSAPLAAFRKKTEKARQATANLSRSATVVHAVHRLQLLPRKRLVLHILGVDHVETESVDQIRTTFGPLVRWLSASPISPEALDILLIGPNIVSQVPVDLMPKSGKSALRHAVATCHAGEYHFLDLGDADLAVAFNAGLWGYDSWIPTLEKMKTTFVVTSYTLEEAEEDADVLQARGIPVWTAIPNPFGSNTRRDTLSIQDRIYRENAVWQAWDLRH